MEKFKPNEYGIAFRLAFMPNVMGAYLEEMEKTLGVTFSEEERTACQYPHKLAETVIQNMPRANWDDSYRFSDDTSGNMGSYGRIKLLQLLTSIGNKAAHEDLKAAIQEENPMDEVEIVMIEHLVWGNHILEQYVDYPYLGAVMTGFSNLSHVSLHDLVGKSIIIEAMVEEIIHQLYEAGIAKLIVAENGWMKVVPFDESGEHILA